MGETSFNPLQGIFDLLGKKIEADAAAKQASRVWGGNDPNYGIDEYGRIYPRGGVAMPNQASALIPLGVAALVVVGLVLVVKS